MQVVMNKYFLLNPEKIWHKSVLLFSRKTPTPTHSQFRKNDVTEPRLGYSNN